MAYLALGGGLQAWPIIPLVVEVGPAADRANAERRQQFGDGVVQLAFAVVAARAVVAQVVGILELVGADDLVANSNQLRNALGFLQLGTWHAGAVGGDGNGAIAERQERRLGNERAIDATGERDRRPRQ